MPILSSHRAALLFPSPDIFAPSGPSGIYQGAGTAQSVIMLIANPVESFASADVVLGIGNVWSIEMWVYWTGSLPVVMRYKLKASPSGSVPKNRQLT